MPKILEDLVSKLKAKSHDEQSARAIATSQLQKSGKLKPVTQKLASSSNPGKATRKPSKTKNGRQ